MKSVFAGSGLLVDVIGMGVFFLVWMGLVVLAQTIFLLLGVPHVIANGVAVAVMSSLASAFFFTGEVDRFNQLGLLITKPLLNRD